MPKFSNFNRVLPLIGWVFLIQPLMLAPSLVHAQEYTHFVSDSIQVPLRRGAGTEFRIERMLAAGSPIKVLEVGESNWSRVEYTLNGRTYTGWVNKVAIQSERPAKMRLEEQTERANKFEARLKQLQSEHNELKDQAKSANKELETLKQEQFELTKEMEHLKNISGSAIELDNQNHEMRKTISELESQNIIMQQQIAQAEDAVKRQWFLTGAGVLLLGLIIGRLFRMPKRRGGWDKI